MRTLRHYFLRDALSEHFKSQIVVVHGLEHFYKIKSILLIINFFKLIPINSRDKLSINAQTFKVKYLYIHISHNFLQDLELKLH